MIFATIGTQLPFDRLLSGLDSWSAQNTEVLVVAQVGATNLHFRNLQTFSALPQAEFRKQFEAAHLVVAHAGMGTILSALEFGKPLIVMPRRNRFGEHRNDHQQDTALEMSRFPNVVVASNGEDLHAALDRSLARNFAWPPTASLEKDQITPIIGTIREFVWGSRDTPEHSTEHVLRSRT